MLSIATQETKTSSTCEGVTFTIRKLSRIQRSLRDLPIFVERLKAEELTRRYWDAVKRREAVAKRLSIDPQADDMPEKIAIDPEGAEINREIVAIDYEFGLVNSGYLVPASVRAGLVSITGLEIDGKPATAESLATSATPEIDDLVREIYAECEAASGLTGAQRKNSPSPTTSDEPVAGEATSSSTA